ncbi:MAG: polysaccharide biosynthesis tyrosine autokinase [candidate division KSB1 bacterium]|nr:polysaccharide biosynthesis tyrosine autokinase [candidate division KSB1 bacterium]MDZ7368520.1 polysaccharide biosynthesis tyrosine autokinase [candidate division KSB1 bacterium]MDZ7406252.1 polysaccharide biosynthesis tyrosine autokinase [candidate division KSB1 bacterium]
MGIDPYLLEEQSEPEGPKLDLLRYWKALKKRWWVVAITTVVVTVPWVLHVKKEQPVYEATATIRFTNYAGNSDAIIGARYQQFHSRSFYERIVSELGLVLSIEQPKDQEAPIFRKQIFSKFTSTSQPVSGSYALRFPGDGTFSLKQILGEGGREVELRRGNIAEATLDTIAVNGFSFQLTPQPKKLPPEVFFSIGNFRSTVKSLQGRVKLEMARDGTMAQVTMQDIDPFIVTQTVNSLARLVVQESEKTATGTRDEQIKILQAQLEKSKQDLDASNERLKFARQRSTNSSEVAFSEMLSRRSGLDRELNELKISREALHDLLARLNAQNAAAADPNNAQQLEERWLIFRIIAGNRAFEGSTGMALTRQRLEDAEKEWNEVIRTMEIASPRARELQRKIEQLHAQIEEMTRARMATLEREIAQKGSELAQLNARVSQLPSERIELSDLERENQQFAKLYEDALSRYRTAQLEKAVKTEFIDILDPAIEPDQPINSNKKTKAAAGGAFGFALGIMIVLLWEMLDRTLKTVDDVKGYLKLDVLGAIPQVAFDNVFDFQDHEKAKLIDQQLVTHDFAPTPIGEAYRSLRTSLIYNKKTGRLQTLVLTSTAPGDGKSFTAANLGITLAQQKSKTLLVDTDLRRGVQHNTFGVPKEPGFSNYLCGQVISADIINETHIPNLSMISCGALVPNPSELLGSLQMRRFLDEMRRKFDVIIFDTPPLNAATDAVVLGTQVDGVAIVVRAGKTHREVARQKLELFRNLEAKVIGVILNGTSVDLAHEGYSYYHY